MLVASVLETTTAESESFIHRQSVFCEYGLHQWLLTWLHYASWDEPHDDNNSAWRVCLTHLLTIYRKKKQQQQSVVREHDFTTTRSLVVSLLTARPSVWTPNVSMELARLASPTVHGFFSQPQKICKLGTNMCVCEWLFTSICSSVMNCEELKPALDHWQLGYAPSPPRPCQELRKWW